MDLTPERMIAGGRYNWKHHGPERLVYMGKAGNWHQFCKVGETKVWCEVIDSDLCMFEPTQPEPAKDFWLCDPMANFFVHEVRGVVGVTWVTNTTDPRFFSRAVFPGHTIEQWKRIVLDLTGIPVTGIPVTAVPNVGERGR